MRRLWWRWRGAAPAVLPLAASCVSQATTLSRPLHARRNHSSSATRVHERGSKVNTPREHRDPSERKDSPPDGTRRSKRRRAASAKRTNAPAPTTCFDLGNGIRTTVPVAKGAPAGRSENSSLTTSSSSSTASKAALPTVPVVALTEAAQAVQRGVMAHSLLGSTPSQPAKAAQELIASLAAPVDVKTVMQNALPLLLSAPDVLAQQEHLGRHPELLSALAEAQSDLAQYLQWLDVTAARTTGRRYESAFPTSLITRLWAVTMPALFSATTQLTARQREADLPMSAKPPPGTVVVACEAASSLVPKDPQRSTQAFLQSFRAVRRALAVRTRTLADLVVQDAPDDLAAMLARMQHCGALSDDVLSPIAERLLGALEALDRAPQAVAKNHTLTAHTIATPLSASSEDAPDAAVPRLTPTAAITLARLLGRQQAPNHFHLHKLTHTVLLPVVQRELATSAAKLSNAPSSHPMRQDVPPRSALEDLTRCFVHYAVSGPAVEYLTKLWQPYILGLPPSAGLDGSPSVSTFTLVDCTELLRVVARPPAVAAVGKLRRRPEKLSGSSSAALSDLYLGHGGRRQGRRESLVAADDYVPLVEMLCESVAEKCQRYLRHAGALTTASCEATPGSLSPTPTSTSAVGPSGVLAEADLVMAPEALVGWMLALLHVDSARWAEVYTLSATATLVSLSSHASGNRRPADVLPIALVEQLLYELLHRNTHLPDHPLHWTLLQRLLHATETTQNARYASTALLAFELMSPPPSPGSQPQEDVALHSRFDVSPQDHAAALSLLQQHGSSLGITAFAAALCVAPLQELSLKAQARLLNDFTSIASALHPAWLARAIVAVTEKLSPQVVGVDGVAVHKWFSRFTAVDVTRRLDLAQCTGLLKVLAAREEFLANNAIALNAIVRRVGILLRSETHQDAALEVLPSLLPALQEAHVSFASLFSRVCRLMLSEVGQAPWELLLPAFAATADEFMRRPRQEASGTVFRDVWELLRKRVMSDAAESLELPDVLSALNGFAALDGEDRPLFLVLTRRLWVTVLEEVHAASTKKGVSEEATGTIAEVTTTSSNSPDDDVQDCGGAHVRARVGRYVCNSLTPSAIAVLTVSLLYKRAGPDVDVMLPWVLVALATPTGPVARELYPIEVVQLMPALLAAFTHASSEEGSRHHQQHSAVPESNADVTTLRLGLLHRAYDACREQFLLLYHVLPQQPQLTEHGEVTRGPSSSPQAPATAADSSPLVTTDDKQILEQREQWTAKVRASVEVVPKRHFASILVELSGSGLRDSAVATACAVKCSTTRCCQELLSIQGLVDLCMALCMQFPPPHATPLDVQEPVAEQAKDTPSAAAAVPPASSPRASFMAPVLNALWHRTDELEAQHIDALLRCVGFYYGENVDADFVERLQKQKSMVQQRKDSASPDHQQLPREQGNAPPAQEEDARKPSSAADTKKAMTGASAAVTAVAELTNDVDDSVAQLMMESLGEEL